MSEIKALNEPCKVFSRGVLFFVDERLVVSFFRPQRKNYRAHTAPAIGSIHSSRVSSCQSDSVYDNRDPMSPALCIVADRSVLAANMYRLLLASRDIEIVHLTSLEELLPRVRRERRPYLLIVSSNIFADRFEKFVAACAEGALREVHKIVVIRESEVAKGYKRALLKLPHADVLVRPFHPDELLERL